ncbi:PREDICTED: uncharacterized protein LOC109150458 [Ipomoea nil]|uniref:uncharacterized protein LOC109150458 n=1 Tax=Ipomoea nil TaxID=35883 RepID=UPI000901A1AE|nr:PREDICTED: uncharacterized protein LOC109150458 [Ipomoea nil]
MTTYWIATILIDVSGACVCDAHFKVYQNELGELTALTAKILATFSPELEKKREEESYQTLRHALHHSSSNRAEVFKLMFNAKNDDEKIFRNSNDVWGLNLGKDRRTVILLLTSSFDISNGRIHFLNWFYHNSEPYIIWIPITEKDASWTIKDEQQFEKLKEKMHMLFWLNDPQKRLLPHFTRFVKEELFLKFKMGWGDEAILVSIDQKGRIVHPNVMHMILTWNYEYIEKNTIGVQRLYNIAPLVEKEVKEGTSGVNRVLPEIGKMINDFLREIGGKINAWADLVDSRIQKVIEKSTPYYSDREKDLWQQETTWSLHLLAPKFQSYQPIGKLINDWIQEEKYIFLYGGNDIKWVQEFTSKVREIGSKTQLHIELVYVGRNKKIRGIIDKNRMSNSSLQNSQSVWWFWTRLRSMFLSRIYYLDAINCPVKEYNNDEILQGFKKLLAYESTNTTIEGWALLSKGAKVIVCGHGTKMLRVMNEYQIWEENIAPKGFGQAFKDHHEMIFMNMHSCCTLEYPMNLDKIPENETCHECSRSMHKFLTFTCCHGHDVDSDKDAEDIYQYY